jgi:hypothetical protein
MEIWSGALTEVPIIEPTLIPKWGMPLATSLGRRQKPKMNREVRVPRLQLPKMRNGLKNIL